MNKLQDKINRLIINQAKLVLYKLAMKKGNSF